MKGNCCPILNLFISISGTISLSSITCLSKKIKKFLDNNFSDLADVKYIFHSPANSTNSDLHTRLIRTTLSVSSKFVSMLHIAHLFFLVNNVHTTSEFAIQIYKAPITNHISNMQSLFQIPNWAPHILIQISHLPVYILDLSVSGRLLPELAWL